ncbi:MAG TPA: carbamoyltransferase HypF [Chitinivibrionales bacterium]|nr:carbamoyltransferase HypF [Chitinivibrionales bacterium]
MDPVISYHITIKGTVQGVGFRPFVYRLAHQHGISGNVKNDSTGVIINAYGERILVDKFVQSIKQSSPPLAKIRSIEIQEKPVHKIPPGFVIDKSGRGEAAEIDISRDVAVCPACLKEMFDPNNRRFLHPFINCTDCGPRYTIIKNLPYDRPSTTMAEFALCDACKKEYEHPGDRRFHAQPTCCHDCGPKLALKDNHGSIINEKDPMHAAIDLLVDGRIVAIKGIGGFHLACRADSGESITRLRLKKHREEKPFAIMVRDVETAQRAAFVSAEEQALLESPERPIVILQKRIDCPGIASEVAPGMHTLGIMLPYTPVHHLLFHDPRIGALTMTSANLSDEPVVFKDETAFKRLGDIADAFLTHNRAIHMRNDDSIVRVVTGSPVIMRRSRGFVPEPLPAPADVTGLVALGGVLKSTVAIGRKRGCYLSHYIGTIESLEDLNNLDMAVNHLTAALSVTPEKFACDLHPQSLVASYAEKTGLPVVKVQHHHAHAAACMAENEIRGDALALVFDGTGYGPDGRIWGGEILHATYKGFSRLGHLSYMLLPGGDEAIRNPGRIALAALHKTLGEKAAGAFPWMPEAEKRAVLDMVESGAGCVESSGMGRLFDAASALLAVCTKRTYEGQPAIMLEGICDPSEKGSYGLPLSVEEDGIIIDAGVLLHEVYKEVKNKTPVQKIAARFHTTLAQASAAAAAIASQQSGCKTVCLSGGVFQNAFLVERLVPLLSQAGLLPALHRRTPPNDECVSYGQLAIAAAGRR